MAAEPEHSIEREYAVALNLWGWLCLLGRAIAITVKLVGKLATAIVGGKKRRNGHSLHKYIAYEGMRDYQYGFNAVGIQNLLPSTRWMASHFARSNRMPFAQLHLRDGTTAFRLGGPKTSSNKAGGSNSSSPPPSPSPPPGRSVVMFHGGGYMGPALGEHIQLACGFSNKLPEGATVYILQYALVSETANHYPRQLQQATVLLDYLIHTESIPPANITLIGDSAGGHLAISLLLHLVHPNPNVPALALKGQRLAGAALISPWMITANRSEGLVQENEANDVLHAAALAYWAQNFLGLQKEEQEGERSPRVEPWSCPLTTPGHWWADLPVDDLFVTYGEDEVLRDNAAQLCSALLLSQAKKKEGQAPRKVLAKGYAGEMHVHMVMNRLLRLNEPCKSEQDFIAWYKAQMAAPVPATPTASMAAAEPPAATPTPAVN
ncbi:hypothetical protein SCUCBS95973_000992 [Sporothrix curviconia]|uniref:Alpha/beta hydrolase fold-3 domain-containing protein n=1 Tax=Sporothrix curviconia TaxID=1260050 RepID=A0ABP0AUS8_9PEZI